MCQINRAWLPICLAFVLFLGVAFPALSSSIIPPRDFGELVRISDLVVVAKAGGGSGYKKGELIMTGTMFTIMDVVKGSISIGTDIRVETFGGIYGDRGLAIGGSPQFKDGDVYLLSLSEFNGEWTLRFMSYGVLVQRRMVTGQQVFAHLEEAHELNVVVPDGREIEPITTYSSSTVVSHLKQVSSGSSVWSRESAGEVANAGHDGSLQMNDILGLDAAPPGCVYMNQGGTKIRWRRFEQSLNVGVKVINGAPANVVTAVQNSITAWKAIPGIDMGTLNFSGNNPVQAGCPAFGGTNLNAIPIGDSHIYLDDPCNEVADLVGCSGILAIAGPAFDPDNTHMKNGETWIEALLGVMVVNNGTPGCITPIQYEQTITHELGHILGFGHHTGATANMNASCCSPITALDQTCAVYSYGTGASNPVPVIASLTPNNANQGTNNLVVQINGTDFVTGGTLSTFGPGITLNSAFFINSTQLTVNISIAPDATPGARNVTYTNVGPGGGTSNAVAFTVNAVSNPVPVLSSITPNSGQQGQAVNVTLSGSNFVSGATVQVSGSGVTASSVSFVNSTTITAVFTVAGGATVGARSVTVTNPGPGGGASGSQTFTVNAASNPVPVLSSISPNSGQQGQAVNVTLSGSNFVSGATVQVSGSGVTASSVSFVNSTTITAVFTVAGGATVGARSVTVTNPGPGGGASGSQTFTVTVPQNPVPVITSLNPNSANQGATNVDVQILGSNFVAGGSLGITGVGITVNSAFFISSTQLSMNLTIAADAPLGARDVFVINPGPGGGESNAVAFTITQAQNLVPTLTSVAPNSGAQGTAVPVTLTGTNFMVGSTVQVSGTGVTVSNVSVTNATTMTALFTIEAGATLSARDVTVTYPGQGGGTSGPQVFTVTNAPNPVPVLTTVTPNTGLQGSSVNVSLQGTGFIAGSTVSVSGTGVTVSNVIVVNATTITAQFAISGAATIGARNVTVTNPAPGGGTSNAVTFTVNAANNPVPILTSITPTSGVQGSQVNILLSGSNFVPGSTILISGTGVTVSNVSVQDVEETQSTSISATLTIAPGAAVGPRIVAVSNPAPGGGISAAQTFTVTEPFINKQPTMNAIADVSFLHTAAPQVVNLTGISAGAGENQNLTVTAVAANTQLIQSLSVQYVSPQATGTLVFQNDRRMVGTTTISVKVKDNGGTANGGVDSLIRVFTVNVNLDTNLEPDLSELPTDYELLQNYPNPFNPSTIIPFQLPGRAFVTLGVYDVTGRLRATLLKQEMGAGRHEVSLDASNFGSGLYLVRMTSEFGIKSVMIMLVK